MKYKKNFFFKTKEDKKAQRQRGTKTGNHQHKKNIKILAINVFTVVAFFVGLAQAANPKYLYIVADSNPGVNVISAAPIQPLPAYLGTFVNGIDVFPVNAKDLTIDTDSKTLFVSYIDPNVNVVNYGINMIDAVTLISRGIVFAPVDTASSGFSGIVMDQDKQLLYALAQGECILYIFDWDAASKILTYKNSVLLNVPTTPASGVAIALDEVRDYLFITYGQNQIPFFNTSDWSLAGVITLPDGRQAENIAVDEQYQIVYVADNINNILSKTNYTVELKSVSTAPDIINGLAVDQATGLLYETIVTPTAGKIGVLDSNLSLIAGPFHLNSTSPGGLAVPREDLLNLRMDEGISNNDCANIGENIIYKICFDNEANNVDVRNVKITDKIQYGYTIVSATGNYIFDITNNVVTWDLGTLKELADEKCVELTVRIDQNAVPGLHVWNEATISSDQTSDTTAASYTRVCDIPPKITVNASPRVIRGTCFPSMTEVTLTAVVKGILDPRCQIVKVVNDLAPPPWSPNPVYEITGDLTLQVNNQKTFFDYLFVDNTFTITVECTGAGGIKVNDSITVTVPGIFGRKRQYGITNRHLWQRLW